MSSCLVRPNPSSGEGVDDTRDGSVVGVGLRPTSADKSSDCSELDHIAHFGFGSIVRKDPSTLS